MDTKVKNRIQFHITDHLPMKQRLSKEGIARLFESRKFRCRHLSVSKTWDLFGFSYIICFKMAGGVLWPVDVSLGKKKGNMSTLKRYR